MTFHPNLVIGKLWKVYPDIAARDADSASQTSYHINHIVRVNNPKSFYSLASVGPTVWKEELAGSGSGAPFDPSGLITSITANANQVATHEADATVHVNAADKAALHDGVAQDTALAIHVGDVAAHAGASYDDTAITARVTTLESLDHSQLHDGGPQDTAIAANTAHVADATSHVTAPEKALLHDGAAQDTAIAANTAHVADTTPHMSVPEKAQLHDILTLTTTGGAGPTLIGQVLNLPPAVVSPENIIVGSAAPTAGDGQDGDFWVDASAARWPGYGPKTVGAWPAHDGVSYMFDHGIGTLANFTTTDADHAIAKEWAPDVLISAIKPDIIVNTQAEALTTNVLDGQRIQIGRGANYLGTFENVTGVATTWVGTLSDFIPIHQWRAGQLLSNGVPPVADDGNIYFSDWTIGVPPNPLRARSHYFTGVIQTTEADWATLTTAQAQAIEIDWTYYQSVEDPSSPGTFIWVTPRKVGGDDIEILPDWAPNTAYTTSDRIVAIAPAGVTGEIAGNTYAIRPTADLTSAATLDLAEWGNYTVISKYTASGNVIRHSGVGTYALQLSALESNREVVIHEIPQGITKDFLFTDAPAFITIYQDFTNGRVTRTDNAGDVDISVDGPSQLIFTKSGNAAHITIKASDAPAPSGPTTQNLNPRWLAEAVDSGDATAQGLTWLDPALGHPAATMNDTVRIVGAITLDAANYTDGQIVRAIRDTAGNIDADWALWTNPQQIQLIRETVGVVANVFTVSNDRYSWLSAAGVVSGDTIQMPTFLAWNGFTDERRGVIDNFSGIDLTITLPGGYTGTGNMPAALKDGEVLHWRQTGPTHVTGYAILVIDPPGTVSIPNFVSSGFADWRVTIPNHAPIKQITLVVKDDRAGVGLNPGDPRRETRVITDVHGFVSGESVIPGFTTTVAGQWIQNSLVGWNLGGVGGFYDIRLYTVQGPSGLRCSFQGEAQGQAVNLFVAFELDVEYEQTYQLPVSAPVSAPVPDGYEVAKYTGTLAAGTNSTITITMPAGKGIVDYKVLVNYSGSSWLNPAYYSYNAAFGAQIVADEATPAISMNSIGTSLQSMPYRCLVTFAN